MSDSNFFAQELCTGAVVVVTQTGENAVEFQCTDPQLVQEASRALFETYKRLGVLPTRVKKKREDVTAIEEKDKDDSSHSEKSNEQLEEGKVVQSIKGGEEALPFTFSVPDIDSDILPSSISFPSHHQFISINSEPASNRVNPEEELRFKLVNERLNISMRYDTPLRADFEPSTDVIPNLDDRPRKALIQEFLSLFKQLEQRDKEEVTMNILRMAQRFDDRVLANKGLKKRYFLPPKDNLIEYLMKLIECIMIQDAYMHFTFTTFTVDLIETLNRNQLDIWDRIRLLTIAVGDFAGFEVLFPCRLYYERLIAKNGVDEWLKLEFELSKARGYIKKDCSKATRDGEKLFIAQIKGIYQPLDVEVLRTELSGRRDRLLRAEQIRLKQAELHPAITLCIEDYFELQSACSDTGFWTIWANFLLSSVEDKLSSIRFMTRDHGKGQPFPGYIFQLGQPPVHECKCLTKCELIGGFPTNAPPEIQIRYYGCASIEEREFIELYTVFASLMTLLKNGAKTHLQVPMLIWEHTKNIKKQRQIPGRMLFIIGTNIFADNEKTERILLKPPSGNPEFLDRREIDLEEHFRDNPLNFSLACCDISSFLPYVQAFNRESHLAEDSSVPTEIFEELLQSRLDEFWAKLEPIH